MSQVICQKLTIGYQWVWGMTSGARGSDSQSGSLHNSFGVHQTIGSEPCCRNTTCGWVSEPSGLRSCCGPAAKRIVWLFPTTGSRSRLPGLRDSVSVCHMVVELGGPV